MLILCLVAILWGVTNPFLKNGAKGLENISHPKETGNKSQFIFYKTGNFQRKDGQNYAQFDNFSELCSTGHKRV